MGLMGKGLPYLVFKTVANYQYAVANIIGVQTPGNLKYFDAYAQKPGKQIEVLNNWLDQATHQACSIRINQTPLADRKIFVYAGNMGVAQGMDILLNLASNMEHRKDVGFVLVGRGSDAARLREIAASKKLSNVLFFDEIHPDEIPDLYAQCSVGIVALDPRHKSHNIPGKFLTYMQSGLPVLANVNAGNDLAQLIRTQQVGMVCETNECTELTALAGQLLEQIEIDNQLPIRCKALFENQFCVAHTVNQIITAL
jgi:glycosyltransferase involved in cell wall biosynthesis